jgi:hypothetical protein
MIHDVYRDFEYMMFYEFLLFLNFDYVLCGGWDASGS